MAVAVDAPEVDVRKQVERRIWSSGNYAVVAQLIVEPALRLIDAAGIAPRMKVLDVATGTGNVAIPAARSGASVVAVDLTPELLEKARARGRVAGVEIDWREGDAEALPFAADSFDCVLSTFGAQFAHDHRTTGLELIRVCRPGGLIGLCSWTPEGLPGRYIRLLSERAGGRETDPTDWGDESKLRSIFAGTGVELALERGSVITEFESLDTGVEFLEHNYGCAITARSRLEPDGRWQALRAEIRELFASTNQASDGGLLQAEEYLLALARKPAQPNAEAR